MSDSSGEQPWSDNPNAPQIPSWLHSAERDTLTGHFLGSILYGVVVILFFQCMGALLDPVNKIRRSVKWALVAHTAALFLFLTLPVAADIWIPITEFVDHRNFPGPGGQSPGPTGPIGYDQVIGETAINPALNVMFPLNQWLSDALLLYRCYVIYSMNHFIMALPSLAYLASVVTGIMHIYTISVSTADGGVNVGTIYFSISLALNLLLTLMIVIRLLLHIRNIRRAIGTSDGTTGLYQTVVTMLIESAAFYAITFMSYIIPLALQSWVAFALSKTVGQAQVIAPYLIILRVAKQRALTSEMITSGTGNLGSIQFMSQGTTDTDELFTDGDPTSPVHDLGEVGGGAGDAIEERVALGQDQNIL